MRFTFGISQLKPAKKQIGPVSDLDQPFFPLKGAKIPQKGNKKLGVGNKSS